MGSETLPEHGAIVSGAGHRGRPGGMNARRGAGNQHTPNSLLGGTHALLRYQLLGDGCGVVRRVGEPLGRCYCGGGRCVTPLLRLVVSPGWCRCRRCLAQVLHGSSRCRILGPAPLLFLMSPPYPLSEFGREGWEGRWVVEVHQRRTADVL